MKTFILVHEEARRRCAAFAMSKEAENLRVVFQEQKRKDIQSDKFHAQIRDISKQTTYAGKQWDEMDMKRILIDEFAEDMRQAGTPLHHDGRLIPSEDGRRVIQLGIQSSEFYVSEGSAFIEFLYAYGGARGVVWSEKEAVPA